MRRVLVVGAGVVGLTCAIRLLEAGHRVEVLTRDRPAETTSSVAAALWYPYRALPQDRVTAWSRATYATLSDLAADPATGVTMRPGTELLREARPDPWWAGAVPDLVHVDGLDGYAGGWRFTAPVAEMGVHLRWLEGRLAELGGTVTRTSLSRLPEGEGLVVNASGLGAHELAADPTVTPVRGQVVVVEQVGLGEWWLDPGAPGGPTYVVPRSHDIVLGGTDQPGETGRDPDPAVADDIRARAAELVPALAGARVLRHAVGLRPVRPQVRVERAGEVIHCYGHGGAGVTLSWGCADEVVELAG
ncbi:FAD-dependent oxidoreductase [Serinicoccus kebangsaanensis]|uniref:FAD-dependent oxidoreductase n=1 Tax=Serinicoccus kebangsaanensis TaxID=2602069 RepID=UPI00124E707C|nr:FAD-dependent oxidoreductase [Serinicoccus kebangsaanensis]